jgi:hypothetical protein
MSLRMSYLIFFSKYVNLNRLMRTPMSCAYNVFS